MDVVDVVDVVVVDVVVDAVDVVVTVGGVFVPVGLSVPLSQPSNASDSRVEIVKTRIQAPDGGGAGSTRHFRHCTTKGGTKLGRAIFDRNSGP